MPCSTSTFFPHLQYMSWGTAYPSNGKDACAVATDWFYAEVAVSQKTSTLAQGTGGK